MQGQQNAVHGTQRDQSPVSHGMTWQRVKIKMLRDHPNSELHLQFGHVNTDALSRPAAEREIRESRTCCREMWRKAVRVEGFGIVPEVWMTVGHIWRNEDGRAGRNAISAYFIVLNRVSCVTPDGGIETQTLVYHHGQIRKVGNIRSSRRACAQHLLQFRSQPPQSVRVFGKRVKTPCKTASGCLVASQEDSHDFVAHFLLVQWSAGNRIFG